MRFVDFVRVGGGLSVSSCAFRVLIPVRKLHLKRQRLSQDGSEQFSVFTWCTGTLCSKLGRFDLYKFNAITVWVFDKGDDFDIGAIW